MCTCMKWKAPDFYFGRNLDVEASFGEQVIITPRNYAFSFRYGKSKTKPYAMIGMGSVLQNYPLYAEAMNEQGLAVAGLNFPGNAQYQEVKEDAINVASFELIPWLLTNFASVKEVKAALKTVNITKDAFLPAVLPTPLHWMIADADDSIIVEAMADGLHVYADAYGVLTNNPPYPYHVANRINYLHLRAENPAPARGEKGDMEPFCEGMGAIGLPGDASSPSRFVKASFLKDHLVKESDVLMNVMQFFHVLDNVSMVKGSVITKSGKLDRTIYSCCIHAPSVTYYYKTYENFQLTAISLRNADLSNTKLLVYPIRKTPNVYEEQAPSSFEEGMDDVRIQRKRADNR